jgi:hypothetical protein
MNMLLGFGDRLNRWRYSTAKPIALDDPSLQLQSIATM